MPDPFLVTAATFEKYAADYQHAANATKNISAKAAIMREVAHYLAFAARLRGCPIAAPSKD